MLELNSEVNAFYPLDFWILSNLTYLDLFEQQEGRGRKWRKYYVYASVKSVRPARRTFMNVRQHCRDLWEMCITEWVEEDRSLFFRMSK